MGLLVFLISVSEATDRKLKAFYGETAVDWEVLGDQERCCDDWFNWFFAWWALREKSLFLKDEIVRQLLTKRVNSLGSKPWYVHLFGSKSRRKHARHNNCAAIR